MAQRAALTRTLAREPGVLLLDEPFAALDDTGRTDILLLSILLLAVLGKTADALLGLVAKALTRHDLRERLLGPGVHRLPATHPGAAHRTPGGPRG